MTSTSEDAGRSSLGFGPPLDGHGHLDMLEDPIGLNREAAMSCATGEP